MRVIKKIPVELKQLGRFVREMGWQRKQLNALRTLLEFDGSMTRLIVNLAGGPSQVKPKINILQQPLITLRQTSSQQSLKTLINLVDIFPSHTKQPQPPQLIQRSISFTLQYLCSYQQTNLDNPLFYARSFWNEQSYHKLIISDKLKPIGLHLIEQKVQIYRQLNWTGLVDLEIMKGRTVNKKENLSKQKGSSQENNSILLKQVWARSYSMWHGKKVICELEEYFLPSTFQLLS